MNDFNDDTKIIFSDLLKKDETDTLKIKSIEGKEEEYSLYLGAIEDTIAEYYNNRSKDLKDRDVIAILVNISNDYDNTFKYSNTELGFEIISNLVEALEYEPITAHELTMIIDYLLTSIENRSWIPDKQAYLKWISYFLGLNTEEEEARYVKKIKRYMKMRGIPDNMAKDLFVKIDDQDINYHKNYHEFVSDDGYEIDFQKIYTPEEEARIDEFLLKTDEEKFDYLIQNSPDNADLLVTYLFILEENGDSGTAQELAEQFCKKCADPFEIYDAVGDFILKLDSNIARKYYQKALLCLKDEKDIEEYAKLV
ncbi:hypothetical protein [Methanococcoides sp. NM1]|uniref:hypothetical protein n=1 Tax=Methanococcoides sp. NM1 TaxID=1201013 RepID=UPI0010847E1E|nr:hypothetical protein [Methanococcoides sp. NM1]